MPPVGCPHQTCKLLRAFLLAVNFCLKIYPLQRYASAQCSSLRRIECGYRDLTECMQQSREQARQTVLYAMHTYVRTAADMKVLEKRQTCASMRSTSFLIPVEQTETKAAFNASFFCSSSLNLISFSSVSRAAATSPSGSFSTTPLTAYSVCRMPIESQDETLRLLSQRRYRKATEKAWHTKFG